ncbi:MAG: hypothetical protein AABZ15_07230 [Nitrospirota bacterium]
MMLKTLGLFVLAFLTIAVVGGCWIARTEDTCWKNEATQAFEKYSSLKTRSAILRASASTGSDVMNSKSSQVEVLEKEFNGCSLGSNGNTVLRFYFDDANKLTMMQAFRHYSGVSDPDYQMQLIEERKF